MVRPLNATKRSAGGLQHRPQQRLYQLVSVGPRANLGLGKGQADDALHLSRIYRHRRRRASDEGRPVAVARGTILECLLLERNRLSELLAEGNSRTGHRSIRERSPAAAAATAADLQAAVKFFLLVLSLICWG